MLKLGLIGDIKQLEPYAKKLEKQKDIHIAGKSSAGTNTDTGNFHFSIPEFNRIELIERTDALLINRFSLLPFDLLSTIVKKRKHIFAAEYPELPVEKCRQIANLATEAQTVIQVINPFYYLPAVQWLNHNLKKPTFIDISYFKNEPEISQPLLALLLMLKDITGTLPKKIGAVSFHSAENKTEFKNVRLEFGDASAVNLNFGNVNTASEFKLKAWTAGQVVSFDFETRHYACNNSSIDTNPFKNISETGSFSQGISNTNRNLTGIEDYLSVLQAVEKINLKLDQFSISQTR